MHKVIEQIKKHKINHAFLAKKMNMPKGTFNNKLSENHETRFKPGELSVLKEILSEIGHDLVNNFG